VSSLGDAALAALGLWREDGAVRITMTGDATADVVWQRYLDPQLWHRWAPAIAAAGLDAGAARLHPGATGWVRSYLGPALRFTVTELSDDRWSWRVGVGRVRVTMTHGVDADGATWLELSPLLIGYAPIARLALRRLVRA
jgi:hypothetical protein